MSALQQVAFSRLLRSWNDRENLRSSGASTSEMVEARRRLDDARLEMYACATPEFHLGSDPKWNVNRRVGYSSASVTR